MSLARRALAALAVAGILAGGIAASSSSNADIGAPAPAAHVSSDAGTVAAVQVIE
jgi:hypothetical protein